MTDATNTTFTNAELREAIKDAREMLDAKQTQARIQAVQLAALEHKLTNDPEGDDDCATAFELDLPDDDDIGSCTAPQGIDDEITAKERAMRSALYATRPTSAATHALDSMEFEPGELAAAFSKRTVEELRQRLDPITNKIGLHPDDVARLTSMPKVFERVMTETNNHELNAVVTIPRAPEHNDCIPDRQAHWLIDYIAAHPDVKDITFRDGYMGIQLTNGVLIDSVQPRYR